MRVATEEEDRLLQKISFLESDIYNLENEVMLCESEAKGVRELRRRYTVKFFTVIVVCAFLIILSSSKAFNSLIIALRLTLKKSARSVNEYGIVTLLE